MLATFRIRKDKSNPYVSIHKAFLSNKHLSWRAKGILSYLLSKPDDWIVRVEDIRDHAKESDKAVRSAIQELLSHGYLFRTVLREEGKFSSFQYDVFESPNLNLHSLFSKSTIFPKWRNGEICNETDEKMFREECEKHGLTFTSDMRE